MSKVIVVRLKDGVDMVVTTGPTDQNPDEVIEDLETATNYLQVVEGVYARKGPRMRVFVPRESVHYLYETEARAGV